jgi:hypothetical protein
MKYLCWIAAVVMSVAMADEPIMHYGVDIEAVKPDAICAKAIALLKAAKPPLTDEQAKEFLSVDGAVAVPKCLEMILSELSSPTNGYRVHEVTSQPDTTQWCRAQSTAP